MPATSFASMALNINVPTTVPTSPTGTRKRISFQSTWRRNAASPITSITNRIGIRMAAACGTVTVSAIIGTASDPKPAPKPLLLTPSSSTAGMAAA